MKVVVEADWTELGEVRLDAGGLVFPTAPIGPGVYRFRLMPKKGATSWYVGEAKNVRRRHANYRAGPLGQRTSRWVHLRLIEHLQAGGRVSVSLATEATVDTAGGTRPLNLALKRSRLLVESAALHALPDAESIENRPGIGE